MDLISPAFCRNVLFIGSIVCLLMLHRTETVPSYRPNGQIGLAAPTAVFEHIVRTISHSVTPITSNSDIYRLSSGRGQ